MSLEKSRTMPMQFLFFGGGGERGLLCDLCKFSSVYEKSCVHTKRFESYLPVHTDTRKRFESVNLRFRKYPDTCGRGLN